MHNGRKIHGEAELTADPRAGCIFTSQHGEGETHAPVNCVRAPDQALQLASAEPIVVRNAAINLTPKGKPRIEGVQQGQPRQCKHGRVWFEFPQHQCWCCQRIRNRRSRSLWFFPLAVLAR